MKHILFISYDGMTDPLGQSQVIPYLAGLTASGYRFTILSCDKPEKYKSGKSSVTAMLQPYSISWVSIPYHKSPPVLSSLYDYIQLKKKAEAIYKKDKFDMIHTRPGLPTLVALNLKKKYGVKFLNDIRGFWADERVDGGMWNLKNPLYKMVYRFFKKHEQACIRACDHIICLTHAAEKIVRKEMDSRFPKTISVIPCSADLELFNEANISKEAKQKARAGLHIRSDDIVFSYLGSIGGWYLTDEIMKFFSVIRDKIPRAKILFISPHRHDEIKKSAAQYHIPEEMMSITKATREQVPLFLSLSDYSVFFINPAYSKIASSPTKHGEIMSMSIPVITNQGVGDVAEIVERYNAGFIVEDFSISSYRLVAGEILSGKVFDRQLIRKGAEEYYSLKNAVKSYSEAYQNAFRD